MNINIGTEFHDGYDNIYAKWKVTKKLPNNTWVCQIQDKQHCNVIQVYHSDIIKQKFTKIPFLAFINLSLKKAKKY